MSANLTQSNELKAAVEKARGGGVRALTLSIDADAESIDLAGELAPSEDLEADFNSLSKGLDDETPAMFIVVMDVDTSSPAARWGCVSYVPDTAPVRLKMLYASSVEDIKRTLLADRTVAAYHCTTKDEFVYAGFRESSGPVATGSAFTEAERQVAKENAESQQERSEAAATHTLPFDLTDEARAALERFSGGDVNTVALLIGDDERCDLDFAETLDGIPATEARVTNEMPRYLVLRADGDIVFVYSCPDEAPARQRMVYSSAKATIVEAVTATGITPKRRIEIREPSELGEELTAAAADADGGAGGSGGGTGASDALDEGLAFAKPTGPAGAKKKKKRKKMALAI